MLIRCFWPKCDYRNRRRGAEPMDCYWLEATLEEAERHIFPLLDEEKVNKAHKLAARGAGIAEMRSEVPRLYCFLVAKDLSSIDPFNVAYPFHHMWGAYSPFREMAERHIGNVEEIKLMMPVLSI